MSEKRFKSVLVSSGDRVFLVIPFDPDEAWGSKERHHVAGTINAHRFRGPIVTLGGQHLLALGPAWRRDCELDAGAEVEVLLFPEGPQSDSLEPDIVAAFASAPQAKAFFDALPSFYRKNFTRWIEQAKRPETRAARIAEMIRLLNAGERQR